jgi:hypothetical protein
MLLDRQRVGNEIIKSFGLKAFKDGQFDVEIYGPDDRRFDEALKKDAALAKDLKAICTKAFEKYRDDLGKVMAAHEKARGKLTGDARKDYEYESGSVRYELHKSGFAKMESTVTAETKKRWAKAVSADPTLKGVDFEVVLLEFLPGFNWVRDAAADEEPKEESGTLYEREVAARLAEAQAVIDGVVNDLKEPGTRIASCPALIKEVNEIAAAVQRDYDAGPRESQRDDPDTQGDEEADESVLNKAIFAEHGKAITKAESNAQWVDIHYWKAAPAAAAGAKALTPALKKIAAAAKVDRGIAPATAKELEQHADALGGVIRELTAIDAECKAGNRPLKECVAIWKELSQKQGAALGLLEKGRITLTPPADRWNAAVRTLEKMKLEVKAEAKAKGKAKTGLLRGRR